MCMNLWLRWKCKSEFVPVHDMMVYVGVEVSFCPFITSSLEKRWMVSFMPQSLQTLDKKWGMGGLQCKNALTKRCVTMSPELVQYFTNWVANFSYWKIQINKCKYKHTNHSVMPYNAQGIAITRSLNTKGSLSATCGEQSGAGAGWKCQYVQFCEEITESEASGWFSLTLQLT
jgi:hypothetical protein